MKKVIKKLLGNAPRPIVGEKIANDVNDGLIRPKLIKIWNCIIGIIFYGLILGHNGFIFS